MRGATIKILDLRFYTLTFSLFNINFTALQYSTKYQNTITCATSHKRADHIYVQAGAWQQAGSQYLRLLKDDPPLANSDTRTTD